MSDAQTVQNFSTVPMTYKFRADKETKIRRPEIVVQAPVPNQAALVQFLTKPEQFGKELELVFEALADVVRNTGLSIVADTEITSGNFPTNKLDWTAIARMPKEDRRSSTISDEEWVAFAKDYQAVMPAASGKTQTQVDNAVKLFVGKLTVVKFKRDTLSTLQQQLAIFLEQEVAERHTSVIEFLAKRIENYLAAEDINAVADNL
jgi:hypothetical protein